MYTINKKSAFLLLLSVTLLLSFILLVRIQGSNNLEDTTRVKTITVESKALGKSLISKVFLPENYNNETKYPVLYFIHDYGGTPDTVLYDYGIAEKADALVKENKIKPMIIVALKIESSFGVNSGKENIRVRLESGKSFFQGMYEDYIINEAIPLVDLQFSTISTKEGRYIGGYSLGGYAALHIAFRHENMFSKAGGHSPSLFVDEFPDKEVTKWLYPDEHIRKDRDPIKIAQDKPLSGLEVYLDTGSTDVNVEGCRKLYDILQEKGVKSENHLFPYSHSRFYCNTFMEKYLLFYGSDN